MAPQDEESELLRLLEQGLSLPSAEREDWLQQQAVSETSRTRLRRMLAAEDSIGDFLEREESRTAVEIPRLPGVGDRVGAYRLIRLIEAGGMGVVYLAERADDSYQQQVAIKLVQPLHLAGSEELRRQLLARFDQERSILAQLRHPNIARIVDGGSTESGIPYLVMEYVDGLPLTEHCERKRLDIEQRLRLFIKVCDGVQDAHSHLIVHRDLKPGNILVGDDGEPRLLDFGIAKGLDPARIPGALRGEYTALSAMTPAYASPEQVRLLPITTRSDVYSLGVILYRLLTGQPPYRLDGLSAAQVEQQICEVDPPAPSRLDGDPARSRQPRRSGIGADLDRIVAKALHKQPERRYGSARELAEDLRNYLAGRPVSAHADSRRYRIGKFLRRNWLASVGVSLAVLAVVTAAAIALAQGRQARLAAAEAAEINQFLLDILARSDPGHTGAEVTLGQALDAAAEQVDTRFAERPGLAAGIRYAIGYSMLSRYRLDSAQVQIERGLAEAEQAFGSHDARTLELLEAQALLRQYQGRTSEAIDLFEAVLERLRASGQSRIPLYAVTHNDLGVLYLGQPDYPRANEHIRAALDAIERDGVEIGDFEHAQIIGNLAHALHGLDDLDGADAHYARAGERMLAMFPDGSRDIATLLNNRALLAHDQGRGADALALLRESVAMRKRVYRGDHPSIVFVLGNLAQQALMNGEPEVGLSSAEEAVAMAMRVSQVATEEQVLALTALARVQVALAQPTQASETIEQARATLSAMPEPPQRSIDQVDRAVRELCAHDPVRFDCGVSDTQPGSADAAGDDR